MDWVGEKFPRTVDKAVDKLFAGMSFRDRTRIANMSEIRLIEFHKSYGHYIRTEFRLPGNSPLMQSCQSYAHINDISDVQASYVILTALQKKVQTSNVLRVIK